jgi:2-(3-amino-3-carboxypropyl)histidine synthase
MDTLLARILERIIPFSPKKVFIQVPEGLKTRVQDIAKGIENSGIEVLIGCDPAYGACDLRDKEARSLGADLLLHIGHSDFGVKACLPVVYEPYYIEFDPVPLLKKNLKALERYRKISLLTTIQFAGAVEPARKFLEERGKEVLLSGQARSGKKGILLGCDWTAALPLEKKADCFLYMGSGKFHPLGLARKTGKPVLWLDFETGRLSSLEKEKQRLERIKAYHIAQAREADNFGIMVSLKEGQLFLKRAEEIKSVLEGKGKNAWLLVMDEILPSKIEGMKLDVLVNCACPRIDEDFGLFKKPVINPEDIHSL